jgi:hypothetical protein
MPKRLHDLAKKIEHQYEIKGIPKKEAERIGWATAHKILGKKK